MSSELRISLGTAFLFGLTLSFLGCASITGTETSYKSWRGDVIYQGQGGAVEVVNEVEIWEHGEPNKPYKVIGLITQSKSDDSFNNLLFGSYSQKQLTDIVLREKGDGVVIMSSKRFVSGYTTHLPMNQYDTARTSPDYSKASILAVFQYVDSENSDNHASQPTQ